MRVLILQGNKTAIDAIALANAIGVNYTKINSFNDNPELVVIAGGYEQLGPIPQLKNIPTALIGFKEYRKSIRDNIVSWCKEHNAKAFTWNPNHKEWTIEYNFKFNYLPFGADPLLHHDYGIKREHDISFLGNVHNQDENNHVGSTDMGENFQNIRARALNKLREIQQRSNLNILIPKMHIERGIFEHTDLLKGEVYAHKLASSKLWLCTTSALDVINPRFFECMASKTLVFCNESKSYEGLFKPNVHCITFKMDLSDLEEKLIYWSFNNDDREKITTSAYDLFINNFTWAHRAHELVKVTINE